MKTKRTRRTEHRGATVPRQVVPQPNRRQPASGRWRLLLVLFLIGAAGATWAFFEFVVWNKIPAELVGKWDVVDGPPEYKDASFEFFRNGSMEGKVNVQEVLYVIKSTIRVDGKNIYSTSRHPRTGQERVQVLVIRTLTANELVVEDEQGKIMTMRRAAT